MPCNNLEVDVNGQETFFVSMKILASYSGKLRCLLSTSPEAKNAEILKLIFEDFPGGVEGFELIVRFCYNEGRIQITPYNALLLHSAVEFLEIKDEQSKKCFECVRLWTWSEILDCLKHFQELCIMHISSHLVQEIIDALVENISSLFLSFSCSDNSSLQFSGEMSSTNNSSRFSSFQSNNWLRDLEFLNVGLFEKVVSTMISSNLDRWMLCSFLLHYQKVKFAGVLTVDQKCKIIEVVISTSINGSFFGFPFRSLCHMLRLCSSLKMEKFWMKKVERMIGCRLDEATLDDLMIPSHSKRAYAYDVDLILRLMKIFLGQKRRKFFDQSLKKVGFLIDLYLAEVAPDPYLKPCKFTALALALPDSARESHDKVCEAIDMYFKVHKFLSEEEKIRMCSVLDYEKLSSVSLVKLAEFPGAARVFLPPKKLENVSKHDKDLELRRNVSSSADEEVLLVQLVKGKRCRKIVKISGDRSNVTCLANGKSLPSLCS